ncbi:499_t:CDS:2, partial [Scutellospora calospora]
VDSDNQKFTNSTKCVKSHLNQCEHFKNTYTLEEQKEILNRVNSKSSEVVIATNARSSLIKHISISKRNKLRAIISAGMAFHASKNPEVETTA